MPAGEWIRVKIVSGVGPQATGTYDVEVHLPGEVEPQRFAGIQYRDGFETAGWFGFACLSKERAVFYIDNLVIKPVE